MLSELNRANYRSMRPEQLRERRDNLDIILHHLTPEERAAHLAYINEELRLRPC